MKITTGGQITRQTDGAFYWRPGEHLEFARGRTLSPNVLEKAPRDYDPDSPEPMKLAPQHWGYRGVVVRVRNDVGHDVDEVRLRIKSAVLRRDKELALMRREVEALSRVVEVDIARRERITDTVRLFVWQRDLGKCVKCGSPEKLEFDHIIPVVRGGSNTERNIQLLCERCNRSKGADI